MVKMDSARCLCWLYGKGRRLPLCSKSQSSSVFETPGSKATAGARRWTRLAPTPVRRDTGAVTRCP